MTTDHQQTWETYASAWKAETVEQKRALFEKALTTDCCYTDPLTTLEGWDALAAYMIAFHEQVPGGHFVTTYFRQHHDKSVAKWNMVGQDGAVLGDGISYGEYDADGRLVRMTGFFETSGGAA